MDKEKEKRSESVEEAVAYLILDGKKAKKEQVAQSNRIDKQGFKLIAHKERIERLEGRVGVALERLDQIEKDQADHIDESRHETGVGDCMKRIISLEATAEDLKEREHGLMRRVCLIESYMRDRAAVVRGTRQDQ